MENAHAAASKHEVPTKDSKNMDATVTTTSGVCVVQICPVVGRLKNMSCRWSPSQTPSSALQDPHLFYSH